MKKLGYAIDEFLEYKNKAGDCNTAYFYELTLKEIFHLIHDIDLTEINQVTYLITANRIRIDSQGDEDIFQINMFVLNQFVEWLYEEDYIEFDLAYTYKLLMN